MSNASELLQLAALTRNDFFLLIALENVQRNKVNTSPKFNFEKFEASRCKADFRFEKQDIPRLLNLLRIPEFMSTSRGTKFSGLEGLCILLRRMAYPQRLCDLQHIFGRSVPELSHIFRTVLNFIYREHLHLVTSLNHSWLQRPARQLYADAIRGKGGPLTRCFGFIDGTLHPICRPSVQQREFYSGHKRMHGLKYQSIVIPSGIIANIAGIIPGRRHDSYMLKQSGILNQLDNLLGTEQFYLYADTGYPLKRHLIRPYQGNRLTPAQVEFNKSMSSLRVAVEWEFSDLFRSFAFLDFRKNQKVWLQPVAKHFFVAVILKNCKTCLYGSETSSYFNVKPPTLQEYLNDE